KVKVELAIAQQERDQYFEKNKVLKDRLQWIEESLDNTYALGENREADQRQVEEAIAQRNYWEKEHGKALEELNRLRQSHHQILNSRWWRLKAKVGRSVRKLIGQ
ncbi:MAG: hypothetical protein ACFCBU_08525, partial [Cyanophyceae cyanobacterium]